jgi:hypothetical protein
MPELYFIARARMAYAATDVRSDGAFRQCLPPGRQDGRAGHPRGEAGIESRRAAREVPRVVESGHVHGPAQQEEMRKENSSHRHEEASEKEHEVGIPVEPAVKEGQGRADEADRPDRESVAGLREEALPRERREVDVHEVRRERREREEERAPDGKPDRFQHRSRISGSRGARDRRVDHKLVTRGRRRPRGAFATDRV